MGAGRDRGHARRDLMPEPTRRGTPRRARRRPDAQHSARELVPLVVRDYILEVIQEDGMRERMKQTIRQGLAEDPDFALRVLRFQAELGREIGPMAGFGDHITILVNHNLDDDARRHAVPRAILERGLNAEEEAEAAREALEAIEGQGADQFNHQGEIPSQLGATPGPEGGRPPPARGEEAVRVAQNAAR
jgi:hypothetical protein